MTNQHHTTPELREKIISVMYQVADDTISTWKQQGFWEGLSHSDMRRINSITELIAKELSTLETKHRAEVEEARKLTISEIIAVIKKYAELREGDNLDNALNEEVTESLTTTTSERRSP